MSRKFSISWSTTLLAVSDTTTGCKERTFWKASTTITAESVKSIDTEKRQWLGATMCLYFLEKALVTKDIRCRRLCEQNRWSSLRSGGQLRPQLDLWRFVSGNPCLVLFMAGGQLLVSRYLGLIMSGKDTQRHIRKRLKTEVNSVKHCLSCRVPSMLPNYDATN